MIVPSMSKAAILRDGSTPPPGAVNTKSFPSYSRRHSAPSSRRRATVPLSGRNQALYQGSVLPSTISPPVVILDFFWGGPSSSVQLSDFLIGSEVSRLAGTTLGAGPSGGGGLKRTEYLYLPGRSSSVSYSGGIVHPDSFAGFGYASHTNIWTRFKKHKKGDFGT